MRSWKDKGKPLIYRIIISITFKNLKLNLWLTAPKGAAPVNLTSATGWQMAARRDNVISITLR